MADQNVFTLSQVAQHKSKNDCWFVIDGRVLNVTSFLEEHPGGEEVLLLEAAGKDASKEFKDVGHSKEAQNVMALKYQVGVLQGYSLRDTQTNKGSVDDDEEAKKKKKMKEMSAFVVKESKAIKYGAVIELFVPLLVAGSYFTYRYLQANGNGAEATLLP